ncbi:hypothetical protein HN51_010021 [Arachis hypogaea]|uniref:CCT domain-containing protein n=2 Tax=Arachis TaxID=3817 RepID=A0A445E4D9_ARAHY|nr:uncharacterized protein LOC107477092 [Arachis duranensis]XP_025691973.1 uncharacterized protein LOC112792818 [Arachis hypogaea]QHO55018.1 Zinc finger protein CONSTANS-LIKE [Arachis hypogaea]RYR70302.1 hypothetical protein Ahy_A03g016808 [Arachis hypogaea]
MYNCNGTFCYANNDDHFHHMITPMHSSSSTGAASHQWQLMITNPSEASMSASSGCSTPSSLASCGDTTSQRVSATKMHKSVSSHSLLLQNNNSSGVHHNRNQLYPSFSALFCEFLNSDDAPVRRVYSTGDLQEDTSLSSESSMIIEAMSRASPYSPEEKKIRIERYRIKRNQRNFNKKIKYACRKTLADSRPRIRGRFAKNDEIVRNPPSLEWCQFGAAGEEQDEEDENNWANLFDSLDPANVVAHHHQEQQDSSPFGVFY